MTTRDTGALSEERKEKASLVLFLGVASLDVDSVSLYALYLCVLGVTGALYHCTSVYI